MNKFSDPAWWPKRPPAPVKTSSRAMVVVGAVIPILVIGALFAFFLVHKSSSKPAQVATRSVVAFQDCMKAQGADSASVSANARLLQLAAQACQGHLPKGFPLPDFSQTAPPTGDAREAFQQCVQSVLSGLGGSGGRFSRPSQKAVANAVSLCRSVTPGAPGQGRATT